MLAFSIICWSSKSCYFQTSLVMSVYMTISVSVERYISVLYPLLSIRLHSRHSYLYLALPSLIFSVIFTLPTYFVVETKCLDQNDELKENEVDINISQVSSSSCVFVNTQYRLIGKISNLDFQE